MNTTENQTDLELVKTVKKLTRFQRDEKIDYDEYASNVIIHLVGKKFHDVCECLVDLSNEEHAKLVSFAQAYFENNDYSPHPTVFMVDTNNADDVEKKRAEMRPKYEQLMKDLEKCKN